LSLCKKLSNIKTKFNLVVFPSFPYIKEIAQLSVGSYLWGGQDCANKNIAAFTGSVSAAQLKELGCSYCIVGHSERRMYCRETATEIRAKIENLLDVNITPILCVGEDQISHKSGKTKNILFNAIDDIGPHIDWSKIIIAYEPIWAIGTGQIPTNEEISFVADFLKKKTSPLAVLYGGSVNSENINNLREIKNIDGFLVGSSSTKFSEMNKMLAE
jgi:triosephosphate isomerase